jgi:hypothetical protein
MGKAAHGVVALQHQNAFPAVHCKKDSRSKTTDARSDDDHVPLVAKSDLFVRSSIDSFRHVYLQRPGQNRRRIPIASGLDRGRCKVNFPTGIADGDNKVNLRLEPIGYVVQRFSPKEPGRLAAEFIRSRAVSDCWRCASRKSR